MNLEHYKAAAEATDADERALIPVIKRTPNKAQPQHSPLPDAMLESVGYHKGYKAAKAHADKLADDLREILAMAESRSRVNMQNGVSLAAFVRCSLAAYEAAQ